MTTKSGITVAIISKLHEWYQEKKALKLEIVLENNFSPYEGKLYQFLLENIFSNSTKLTWNKLVAELSKLGFEGSVNTKGNGSTWNFRITPACKLFGNDENLKFATFNVHKYKGNDPVNPKYLRFFQTGFSNVFGIDKDYINMRMKYNVSH